jgi:hypothetical protein
VRGLRDRNAAARSAGYGYFFSGPVEQHPYCQTGCELRMVNASEGDCLECRAQMSVAHTAQASIPRSAPSPHSEAT